jgi:hypothetical protein
VQIVSVHDPTAILAEDPSSISAPRQCTIASYANQGFSLTNMHKDSTTIKDPNSVMNNEDMVCWE